MAAERGYQIVTANRLRDGVPIYFVGSGVWSPQIGEAHPSDDGDALLAEAQIGPMPLEPVAPYLIAVTLVDGAASPIGLREHIRAFGPTA